MRISAAVLPVLLATEHVEAVLEGSAAAVARLLPGDELLALGEQRRVRTLADVQWALHRASYEATTIDVRDRRADREHEAELVLPADWQR